MFFSSPARVFFCDLLFSHYILTTCILCFIQSMSYASMFFVSSEIYLKTTLNYYYYKKNLRGIVFFNDEASFHWLFFVCLYIKISKQIKCQGPCEAWLIHMFINSKRTYKKSDTNNWKVLQIEVKVYQDFKISHVQAHIKMLYPSKISSRL